MTSYPEKLKRYFKQFLLFAGCNPSFKLTGDQMANYRTHFAQEMGGGTPVALL